MSPPQGNQSCDQDKGAGTPNIFVDWKQPAEYYNFAKRRRRGWKAIFWEGRAGATESTIDWGCPQCGLAIHADHTNTRRCPRCGLMVGEQPIIHEQAPRHIRNMEWKTWWAGQKDLIAGDDGDGGRGQDGTQTQHKAPRPRRASSGARRKI